jgi:hypothetical protein
MKNKIGKILLICLLGIIPTTANAAGFSVNINCPSTSSAGAQISCNISATPSGVTLNGVNGTFNLGSGLTFKGFTASSGFSDYSGGSSSGFVLGKTSGFSSTTTLGTLNVAIPSDATSNQTYTVGLTNVAASDTEYNDYNANSVSATIRIKSNENRLSSLSISGGSINFNPDTTSYSTTINSQTATISAIKKDSSSSMIGNLGTVSLNYGTNTFKISVTSETGVTRTYTINITRPDTRSKNNYLSSLVVSNTNISFNRDTLVYNLSTTSDNVQISATKDDNKTSVTGTGRFNLNYGTNTYRVNVTAENGSTRTYTININREDTRSSNNNLKSLTLSKGNLNFNKSTTTYNVDVDKDTTSVKIEASLEDVKASFENGFGPRTINLNPGNNTIYIKVRNEIGNVKTYTININREDGKSSDSTLKEIKLSEGKIDFKTDVLEYKVNVEYDVNTFKIDALPTDGKSKVNITGDEKLKVGENTFTITVEAENGKITTYIVKVTRKEEGYKLSTNNYIKSLTIKNHSIDFDKKTYKYTIKTKEKKLDISVTLDDRKSEYKISGNKNLKNGSKVLIKVIAEDGSNRTYTLNIKKSNNALIITLIIVITIITGGAITFILLKRKKKPELEQISAEDFTTIKNNVNIKENTTITNNELSDNVVEKEKTTENNDFTGV